MVAGGFDSHMLPPFVCLACRVGALFFITQRCVKVKSLGADNPKNIPYDLAVTTGEEVDIAKVLTKIRANT